MRSSSKFLLTIGYINIIPIILMALFILITKDYQSEFKSYPLLLDETIIVFVTFIIILGYFIFSIVSLVFSNSINFFGKRISTKLNLKIWDRIFSIILILQIIFFVKTGVGKLLAGKTSTLSPIFNLIELPPFFVIYYFIARRRNNFFILNVLGYCGLELSKGWTGFIYIIFLCEIYFFINKRNVKKFLIYYPLTLLIGGKAYEFIYPMKNYIRLGIFEYISYKEGLIKLIERLNYLPHALVGLQNSKQIKKLYYFYGENFIEIRGFLRPILPRFVMEDKEFRSINNLLMNSVYPDLGNQTSANMGLFSFLYNLININLLEFAFYIIFALLIVFFIKAICDLLSTSGKTEESRAILYYFMINFYNNGSLETSFYGTLKILIIIAILVLFKGIRILIKEG